MGSVAQNGIQEVTSTGPEGSTTLPAHVFYTGGKLQWRNVIYPNAAPLLPGINKFSETGLTPFRFNPDSGGLWVDISLSRSISRRSGEFTGNTVGNPTKSVEMIANASVSHVIYLSYVSYNVYGNSTKVWCSYGGASVNLGTGQATPTSTSFLRNRVVDGSIIAKDFGDARVLSSSTQNSLWLNVAASTPAVEVIWNVFYSIEEVYYG